MTHAELQAALARMDITVDASEAHGRLCGALCVREAYGATDWLAELADDAGGEAPVAETPLAEVPAETLAALESDGFEFVRAGAQLAYDELAGARAHAAG